MTYKTSKMLEDCLNARPHKIDGRDVDTKRAMPRSVSRYLCTCIYKTGRPTCNRMMAAEDLLRSIYLFSDNSRINFLIAQ